MNEQARPRAFDVAHEWNETEMNLVISVMNIPRWIVSDENVDCRKRSQQPFDLVLVVEVVTARFVTPRAMKTAEPHAINSASCEVKVNNRGTKRRSAVMIPFDR